MQNIQYQNLKRYFTFNQFLREQFGIKVQKISLDAGFTCPNRDGKVGYGGCIYCHNPGFVAATPHRSKKIREQIEIAMISAKKRRFKGKFLAYFQAYSNTYAPVDTLKQLYDEALEDDEIVGLSVGTRPDCVSEEVLSLLERYALRYLVWIEYGLQSAHDKTLKLINRGHDFKCFRDAVKRTRDRGIYICAHVILGLPGEDEEKMYETIRILSDLKIDGIKLHHLQVVKQTVLEDRYRNGGIRVFSRDEYISLVCNIIERLPSGMVIHRLMGDVRPGLLVAPDWKMPKTEIIARVDKELERRNTYQGIFL